MRMDDLKAVEAMLEDRFQRPSVRAALALKRLTDIVASILLIILLLPIFLISSLLVAVTSRGPVLFRHHRWGRGGELFECLKFRSMHVNGEHLVPKEKLTEKEKNGVLFKDRNDPRVTPIGSWLRKTSVDELPQLFNVLRGDMSLVGPRPLMVHMLEPFPELRRVRCKVRPGITGLWQIRAREDNTSVHSMIQHDLEYLMEFNLWLDCRILMATVPAVVRGAGAF